MYPVLYIYKNIKTTLLIITITSLDVVCHLACFAVKKNEYHRLEL